MPSQFVKVQLSTNFLLEVSPNSFPSGAGFFSFTSSQYFPPRIPLGWWVYDGTLADTSSELFLEGVVVPGQGDVTETTGSLIHTGSTEFTGSVNVSNDLIVIGSASVAELDWDGSVQGLSLFSSSVSSEFTDIEIDSGSFDNRLDFEEATSSDHEARIVLVESTSSDHEARIVLVEATSSEVEGEMDDIHLSGSAGLGLWTASNGDITRDSNIQITGNLDVSGDITAQEFHIEFISSSVLFLSGSTKFGDSLDDQHSFTGSVEITGSLNVDGTASVAELKWDGSVQNLTLFSESVSSEFTDIEIDSGSFDNRIDDLETLDGVGFFFQAIHTGSTNINTISPVSLSWDAQDLLDSPFTHSTVTSSSEIQIGVSGWYDISYSILHQNEGNSRKSIQSVIRQNNFFNIEKSTVVSYKRNIDVGGATSNVWGGLIQLSSSDIIELILSNAGGNISQEVNTVISSSLITVRLARKL